MTLEVLHADNHLLVVRKPAGLPVVPDKSGDESLLDRARAWVAHRYRKPGNVYLGVVHRLDRPVSGVCVFARTSKAARRLTTAFRDRRIEKVYLGVVARAPEPERAELEQWLLKNRRENRVCVVAPDTPGARPARTRWRLVQVATDRRRFLVELVPVSGRPHQLRVLLASLGTPLYGDLKYGAPEALPDRSIALHALALSLPHPTRGEVVRFTTPPPELDVWRFT